MIKKLSVHMWQQRPPRQEFMPSASDKITNTYFKEIKNRLIFKKFLSLRLDF